MINFQEIYTSLGLSPDQADLYASLIANGPQTAIGLAKTTRVKRTYVYKLCQELIKLGLVRAEVKGRTTQFVAESPDHLLSLAENQKFKANQAVQSLENVLPTLKSQFAATESRPVITYYEGIEGLKKVFTDIYAPKPEPVYGCVDLESSDQAIPDYVTKKLIPLRIQNQVKAITILANSKNAKIIQAKDSESLRESTLVDKNYFPLPAEIDVYEDKIAMLSFEKGKFTGIIIQNQTLATSLKSIFKLAVTKST